MTLHRVSSNYQMKNHFGDRHLFENQYYQVEAKFNELLHPVFNPHLPNQSSPRTSLSGHSKQSQRSYSSSAHIKLLPTYEDETYSWLHFRDTFEALVVHNTVLSNVQKFHYLLA